MSEQKKPWEQNWNQPPANNSDSTNKKPWEQNWSEEKTDQPKDKGFLGQAKDHAVSFLGKGAVGVGEIAVGLSDVMSDGATGKILADKLGYDPKATKNSMTGWQSEQYQQQLKDSSNVGKRKIEEGDDFATKVGKKFDNAVDITKNVISNPSLLTNTVAESLLPMVAGAALGRGTGIANPIVAGAVGEGAVMAGSQAEQIRQQTVDGRLTADQSLASVGTGALGGLLGFAGGRLTQKIGLSDVDTAMQTGRLTTQQVGEEIAKTPMRAIPTAMIKGAISEGFLEELPQSVSEQILQNLALDKPWHDGVENAAVMGALAGMAMGGTVSGLGKAGDWLESSAQQRAIEKNWTQSETEYQKNLLDEYRLRSHQEQEKVWNAQDDEKFLADLSHHINNKNGRFLNQPTEEMGNLGNQIGTGVNPNLLGFNPNNDPDAPVNPNGPDTPPAPNDNSPNGNYFDNDYGSDAAFDDLLAAVPPSGQTPSQQMGINPNDGPMSSAAALAVDSGASPVAQLGYTPTQQTQEQSNTPISDALPSDYRQLLESQNGKQPFSTGLENAGESTSQQYDANAIARQTETNDAATDQTETIQPILGADGQNKWFGSQDKAQAFIDKKNLGNDYQVVQDGKRFEIQPKQVAQNDNLNNQNTTPDIENNIEKSQEIADLEQQFANEKSVPKEAQIRKQITELQNGLVSDQSQGDVPNPYDENNLRANVRNLSLQASKEAQAQNADDSNYVADLGSTASARSNEKVKQQFPELYKRAEELAKTAEISSAGRRGNTSFSNLSFKGDSSFVSGDPWTKRPTKDEILQQAIWHLSQDDKNSAPDDVPPNNELQNADIKNLADSTQETAPPNAAPNTEDLVSVTTNDGETHMVLASELNDSNVKNLTKFSDQGKRVAVKLPRGRIASTGEQSKQEQLDDGFTKVETKYGETLTVRTADLNDTNATNLQSYSVDGKKRLNKISRDSIVAGKSDNTFQKYDDVAKQYGRSVNSDGAILSNKGKDTGVRIKELKGRVRIEQADGKLLYSGPKPESLGKFLEDYWFDQKIEPKQEANNQQANKALKAEQPKAEATKTEATPKPKAEASENRLVSDDRAAELRARLKAKLSQLNSGIDPEILAIGTELAVYHIERGARKFSAFAKNIANDLGVSVDKIRPYLRSWYNGARDMMEDMGADIQGMDSADTVRAELAKLDNPQKSDGESGATGKTETVVTPSGREFEVRHKVVEAADLITSNLDSGAINSEYPQSLQPRDRTTLKSVTQVNDIANKLNPKLLGDSASSTNGAPIVSPGNEVESGNGRTLAIRKAYQTGKADAYKDWLSEQGYDVANMQQPVLVRERITPMNMAERVAYTTESNERETLDMSPSEQAMSDAPRVMDILHLVQGGSFNNTANRDFVNAFLTGVASKNERGTMLDKDGVSLTQDGYRRIEAALLAAAFNDEQIITQVVESKDSDIKAIGNALLDIAPQWAQVRKGVQEGILVEGVNVEANLVEAVHLVRKARQQNLSLSEMLNQDDIFDGSIDQVTKDFISIFYSGDKLNKARSSQKVADALKSYAQLAMTAKASPNLFGDAPLSSEQILGQVHERLKQSEAEKQQDFFSSQGANDTNPGKSSQVGQGPEASKPDAAASQSATVTRTQVERPKNDTTLVQDWGVKYVDGWATNADHQGKSYSDNGLKDGVKAAFLKDSKKYLEAVQKNLESIGYELHLDKKGKPQKVSASESGGDGSGEAMLYIREPITGVNVYMSIGDGRPGSHPQRIGIMYRATMKESDKQASGFGVENSGNQYTGANTSAFEMAQMIDDMVSRLVRINQQQNGDSNVQQLDTRSKSTLAGTQTEDVSGANGKGTTSATPRGSSRTNVSGNGRTGTERSEPPRSVADDPREVSVSARGIKENGGLNPNQGVIAPNAPVDAFVIEQGSIAPVGGKKAKFRANINAITVIKELERDNRPATKAEQKILSKFVGWGGLPEAFKRSNGTIAKGWDSEVAELESLLTDKEYIAAVDSSIAAHYTSTEIVSAMWKAVQGFGFSSGRVLEPSVGTGNFLGLMPKNMRKSSKIFAVELDNITGAIAKNLYPEASIKAPLGFQDYQTNDDYFDLVVGNPPFSSMPITDRVRPSIHGFSLHNYFFAKSIDSLKPNGIMAMVVTNRFLDKVGDKERAYIGKRAEMVAAFRLPNDAFKSNAGTSVTTDIIFFRKLADGEVNTGAAWMDVKNYTDKNGKVIPLNEYFVKNPQNMFGDYVMFGGMYSAEDAALIKRDGQDTNALLNEAIEKLPKNIFKAEQVHDFEEVQQAVIGDISAIKVGSKFITADGSVHEKLPDLMGEQKSEPVQFANERAKERTIGMIKLADALNKVRTLQLSNESTDKQIADARAALNQEYDSFFKANSFINADVNKRLMRNDPNWAQLSALEDNYDKGVSVPVAKSTAQEPRKPSAEKAAIFSKRTQKPRSIVTSVTNAKDALVESLNRHGSVNTETMSSIYENKPAEEIIKELGDLVFNDPINGLTTSDEYLSGNVKQKLAIAKEYAEKDYAYTRNVEALERVIPADVEAIDISVKMGSHWLPEQYVAEFVNHIAGSTSATAEYSKTTNTWEIARFVVSASALATYGTDRVNAKTMLENAVNGKKPIVRDVNPDKTTSLNQDATQEASARIELIKSEWEDWLWQNDERRVSLERIYNDLFNVSVKREFDGSHLALEGMTDGIEMRPHQNNGVWRVVQSTTTLLDHTVGAGKTFTIIAAAMELRRMGISNKPIIVVPNHLVTQWANDFVLLYPNANILAASKQDFEKANRKKFVARIANGDYDAVIMAHSSFTKISISPEQEAQFIDTEIADLMAFEDELKAKNGQKSRSAKDIGKRRLALEEKKKSLLNSDNKDKDNIYWHELGVDAIMVDEAHEFKNLEFTTAMQGVAGLGNGKGSQKAKDLYTKIRIMFNANPKAKLVFATGTPISNTMAEMFTMQRYLDWDGMVQKGISHFDAWARVFGEVVTDWELSASGRYKLTNRFAKFVNMPELMQGYLSFADVMSRDDINAQLAKEGKTLGTPKIKGNAPTNIVVERSDDQANYIGMATTDKYGNDVYPEGTLVWRSENLPKKAEKGADNMLAIMGDARKAALDMRLIDPSLPDNPTSKVNVAASDIFEKYQKWNAKKGVQLVFCDLSTPKGAVAKQKAELEALIDLADQGDMDATAKLDAMSPDDILALQSEFSVYDDLKAKLIAKGMKESEVAFIHDANTEIQKQELFNKVKRGDIRVLIGSTSKMGAGMNVQDRLVALHHLDVPWRPSDLEQREGRIIRQKNLFYTANPDGFEVEINRYATKQTLDSRMWQVIESKARFIEQVRKSAGTVREVEDIAGEAANAAEMKAASSGDPRILEEMDLKKQVKAMQDDKRAFDRGIHRTKAAISSEEISIAVNDRAIAKLEVLASVPQPEKFVFKRGNVTIRQEDKGARESIGAQIANANKVIKETLGGATIQLGTLNGFNLIIKSETSAAAVAATISIEHDGVYDSVARFNTDDSASGVVQRILNSIKQIPDTIRERQASKARSQAEIIAMRKKLENATWGKDEELAALKERHAELLDALKPKKKVGPQDGNNDASTTPDDKLYSRKSGNQKTGQTVQQVRETLINRFGKDTIDELERQGKLEILDTTPKHIKEKGIEGYFENGKAVLIADNLSADTIIPTLLHELGGHGGFQNMMQPEQYAELMRQFDRMVEQGNPIALEAQKLAMREKNKGTQQLEMLPYLLTLASNVKNKNAIHNGNVKRFIADLISKVKAWLFDKLGVNLTLTPNDMVALANRMIDKAASNAIGNNADSGSRFSRVDAPQSEVDAIRKQYENTAKWMKAPNGKQTNLTEKQWLQVRTPSFKKWFGDWEGDAANASKVVDANGEPMVVYHGTAGDFNEFKSTRAIWASTNPDLANEYAEFSAEYRTRDKGVGASVIPLYMQANQIFEADNLPKYVRVRDFVTEVAKQAKENGINVNSDYVDSTIAKLRTLARQEESGPDYAKHDFWLNASSMFGIEGKEIIQDFISKMKFDGIVSTELGYTTYGVFRPDQVKSAIGNTGTFNSENADIRFSRVDLSGSINRLSKSFKQASAQSTNQWLKNKAKDTLGIALQALTRRQIMEVYGKLLPQLSRYNHIVELMDADATETSVNADNIVNEWADLKDEQQLAELMHEATLAKIDPAKPFVSGSGTSISKYAQLRKAYDALTPEAQAMYVKARDAYSKHYADVHQAIKERILRSELSNQKKTDLLKQMDDNFFAQSKGVYFPLSRFGKYVVVVRDANGVVESVNRAETLNEAEAVRIELQKQFPNSKVSPVTKDKEFNASRDGVGRGFMSELFKEAGNLGLSAKDQADFEDTLSQLYLASMPDLSWAKHGIHRKGMAGFSQNARRAFAQNMFHGGSYLAKLRYGDQLAEQLDSMKKTVEKEIDTNPDFDQVTARNVYEEMEKRHENYMNPKPHPVSTALTSAGFVYYLGLSPAAAMVNLSQTALVAYPMMGAKFGFKESAAALLKASNDFKNGVEFHKVKWDGLKTDLHKTISSDISKFLSKDEKKAYAEALRRGVIDKTQVHSLVGVAQGEDSGLSEKLKPIMKWSSFMFHHAERFNREVTFVAAYRLAKEHSIVENGKPRKLTNDEAVEMAIDMTYKGNFDYSAGNRARFMQGNVAKVVLLFKQFAQNMIFTLMRQAYLSMYGMDVNERNEARKALAAILAFHGLAAGLLGLPIATSLVAASFLIAKKNPMLGMLFGAGAAAVFFGAGGDEDDPWDLEVEIRNYAAEVLGDDLANYLMKGAPRALGIDLSGRVGLDNLVIPKVQDGLEGQNLSNSIMAGALGPVAGIGANLFKGGQELGDGNLGRAMEAMLPVFMKNPIKAMRYADEGVQDKTGISIQDEVGAWGVFNQTIGFSPADVRLAYEGRSAIYQKKNRLTERRGELMSMWSRARKQDDQEEMDAIWEEIQAFNEINPKIRINRMQLMQSYRQRENRVNKSEDGIYVTRKYEDSREAGAFAFGE